VVDGGEEPIPIRGHRRPARSDSGCAQETTGPIPAEDADMPVVILPPEPPVVSAGTAAALLRLVRGVHRRRASAAAARPPAHPDGADETERKAA
jgi:hypothetical protein